MTFFYDPDGDGAGQADTDYFVFDATASQSYRAETAALIDKGHAMEDVTKPLHAVREDKRATARHEHIHQFASRTPDQKH